MALRDPGAPRRNPLFAVDDAAAGTEPLPDAASDAPPGDDGWFDWGDDPIFGSANPLFGAPGSAMGPFISALTEAGPEAAEHLVNAAHELTLAIKVVVDAFERTLADQRAAFAAEHTSAEGFTPDVDLTDDDPFASAPEPSAPPPRVDEPRVQNIDVE
jgi:hypothetical protein